MIHIKEVTRKFNSLAAVNQLSLSIEKGEIYGLLGPNGAGKTTLIRILCGLLSPDQGKITIKGYDLGRELHKIKRFIGMVPQELAIYEDLSAYANVKFFASLYGLRGEALRKGVADALEFTGLTEAAHKSPAAFSGGMKRRLNIACGVAHKPEIIIMDEPTVGIDPQSRNHILESVKKLRDRGDTVIYTTHYMEEAEALCSRIAIIDHGKIIARGTREELQSLVKDKSRYIVSVKKGQSIEPADILKIQGVLNVQVRENKVFIDNDVTMDNLAPLISYFTEREIPVYNLEMDVPSLEMVFLTLTGRKLRD